jgi:RNA polymerase sigma factor (sigma-70 family)
MSASSPTIGQVTEVDLHALVLKAQSGDQDSWAAIVDHYDRMVWRVASEQGLGDAAARDVAQTTWLRLAENIGKIDHPERLGGWLATTARREAWRVSHKLRREQPDDERVDIGEDVELELSLIADERAAAVWRGLRQLDDTCQRLIRMLLDEVPFKVIAETLDHPIGWVGPTRQRCLAKLAATADVRRLAHE